MLPVEVVPFCADSTCARLQELPAVQAAGGTARLRRGSAANNSCDGPDLAITDNGIDQSALV
jgi:hypothetical protein